MALYKQTDLVKPFQLVGSGSLGLGSKLTLTVEREDKRLEKVRIVVPVTLSGSFGTTASRNLLEGVASAVIVKLSEKGRTSGQQTATNSATLIARQKAMTGRLFRATAAAMRAAANGTFYVTFDLDFIPANIGEQIAYRFAIPLDESVQGADPVIELQLAATAADIGMTGTVAIGAPYAQLFYREISIADGWAYVPTELITSVYTWPQTSETAWTIPNEGLLGDLMLETFASATARGDILAADKYWRIKHGSNERKQWNQVLADAALDEWSESSANVGTLGIGVKPNTLGVSVVNFLHDTALREALNGDSVPSLWTQNGGSLIKLIHTGISSANLESYITHFKFLTADRAALRGA